MSATAHAKDTIRTARNGSLDSRLFLIALTCVIIYMGCFQDYSVLDQVRLQSPITFIAPDQPDATPQTIAAAAAQEAGILPATSPSPVERGLGGEAVATAAQFDLSAVAAAEGIELSDQDRDLNLLRQDYIKRFAPVAIAEMHKFGIPASITIAQGLLETRAGTSSLATKNNNHFGIKCFSRNCGKGHCSNFTDDTHKDFFRKFKSAWESYRAHSKLLRSGRYASIEGDYRAWARGLKKAGYATAQNYDESLIRLIRLYGLDRLDKM